MTRRRRGVIALGAIIVAAVVLGGGAAALAATGVLGQWFGSPDGSGAAAGTGSPSDERGDDPGAVEIAPNAFPDGLTETWRLSASEMLGAAQGGFSAAPVVVGDSVIVETTVGDASIVRQIDAATGATIWEDAATAVTCSPGYAVDSAVCALAQGLGSGPTDIVELAASGEESHATTDGFWIEPIVNPVFEGEQIVLRRGAELEGIDRDGEFEWGSGSVAGLPDGGAERCDIALTGGFDLFAGEGCGDVGVILDGEGARVLSRDAGDRLVYLPSGGLHLHTAAESVAAYAAESGDRLWEVPGQLAGASDTPQVIRGAFDGTGGLLLTQSDGRSARHTLVDLVSGEATALSDSQRGPLAAVSSGEALVFAGDSDDSGRFDLTGVSIAQVPGDEPYATAALVIDDAVIAVGMESGVLIGVSTCGDCVASDGRPLIDEYVFVGAGTSDAGSAGTAETERIGANELPAGMPGCPAGSELLAWAEFTDGWVIVCGIDGEPNYLAVQRPGGAELLKSTGDPDGDSGPGWDERLQRFTGEMNDGSYLVLEADTGTVELRESEREDSRSLLEKWVIRIFVDMQGEQVRELVGVPGTADDNAGEFRLPSCDDMNPAILRAATAGPRDLGRGDAGIFGPVVRTALESALGRSGCEWAASSGTAMQWVSTIDQRTKNALIDGMLDFGYRAEADGPLLRVSYTQNTDSGPQRHTHVFDGDAWVFIFEDGLEGQFEEPALEALARLNPGRFE